MTDLPEPVAMARDELGARSAGEWEKWYADFCERNPWTKRGTLKPIRRHRAYCAPGGLCRRCRNAFPSKGSDEVHKAARKVWMCYKCFRLSGLALEFANGKAGI